MPSSLRRTKTSVRALAVLLASAISLISPGSSDASPLSPIQKGPYLQHLDATSVDIKIEIDPPGPAVLEVSEAGDPRGGKDAGASAPIHLEDKEPSAFHVFHVTGLTASHAYVYDAVVGGAKQTGHFTTAPPPSSREPFRFLIYGDNRSGDEAHAEIVRAMTQTPAELVLNTGDLVANGGDSSLWHTFFTIEAPLLRDRCVFACIGNHELWDKSATLYLRYFGPEEAASAQEAGVKPRLYGSFRWAFARFFLLNAMSDWSDGVETAWFKNALEASEHEEGIQWRIVVLHQSPWSAGPHGGNEKMRAAGAVQALEDHHVDLVIGGHDHIYERGDAEGIRYLVSGGGGAPLYEVEHPLPSTRKAESARHFVIADLSPQKLHIVAQRIDGATMDDCVAKKGAPNWECDHPAQAASATPSAVPEQPAASAPPAPATTDTASSSRCACDVPGARNSFSSRLALAVASVLALALARRRSRRA